MWYSPLKETAISKRVSPSSEGDEEEGKFGRENAEHMWGRSASMRVSRDCKVEVVRILLEDRITMQRHAVNNC